MIICQIHSSPQGTMLNFYHLCATIWFYVPVMNLKILKWDLHLEIGGGAQYCTIFNSLGHFIFENLQEFCNSSLEMHHWDWPDWFKVLVHWTNLVMARFHWAIAIAIVTSLEVGNIVFSMCIYVYCLELFPLSEGGSDRSVLFP